VKETAQSLAACDLTESQAKFRDKIREGNSVGACNSWMKVGWIIFRWLA